jgi:hypothetical protein
MTKKFVAKGASVTLTTDAPELEALLDRLGLAVIGHLREEGYVVSRPDPEPEGDPNRA